MTAVRAPLELSRITILREVEMEGLRGCYASLSGRERRVMSLVASGSSNRQVGNELGVSEGTVKMHRGRAMEKVNAPSIPDLVKIATRLASLVPGCDSSCEAVIDADGFE